MNKTIINGEVYAKLITSGANNLMNNKNKIDALNVFPVPDGDTGTNMSSTVEAAAKALSQNSSTNLSEIAQIVSKNMLLGARGNSGVILSQIFKGFAISFENKESVDIIGLLEGFKKATERAYSSVLKPVEGTILTVIRETTEELSKKINEETSLEEFFVFAKDFARISCNNTPNKLKILREVGVTDSGGEGLYTFIEGMLQCALGNPVEISNANESIDKFINSEEVYDGEFGYCTEFIIELNKPSEFDKIYFEKKLLKIATSVVFVQDNEIVKVHGHTLKPGELLNFGQKYGEFIKIKSENMSRQAEESRNKNVVINEKNNDKKQNCAIVSCNLGSGIINRMKALGCDIIIESGQTQNPSAADIIQAINSANSDNVFILPNNSNIFLTAEQAAKSIANKKTYIIPTRSQIQGLNAMTAFNKESSAQENKELIDELYKTAKTLEVTKAVRDSKINNVKIKEGEFISILDGTIINSKDSYLESAKQAIKSIVNNSTELITVIYGNDASKPDALELEDFINRYYDCSVEIINGDQPNYYFIIGIE